MKASVSPGNNAWTAFWSDLESFFVKPRTSHTLALIRIATGSMIAYIHVVWMLHLSSFMGANALIDNDVWQTLHARTYKWTYLAYTESSGLIWTHELLACLAGAAMAIGIATRITTPLAWFLTLMTVHRMTGFLFGLDQVTVMLALYLMLSRAGNLWSADAWIANRLRNQGSPYGMLEKFLWWDDDGRACWNNTLSTRLIQLHLCVIYFFGGISKLRGSMWWDGSAMWFAASSYEYQSLDMTWVGYMPVFASAATHVTLFWEVLYCAVIWPKYTRWLTLALAVMVHGGIAIFLGMITFGFMMIVANASFIEPNWIEALFKQDTLARDS